MQTPYQTPQAAQQPLAPTRLTFKQTLFSINGRISRSTWWLYSVLSAVAFSVIIFILSTIAAAIMFKSSAAAIENNDASINAASIEAEAALTGGIMGLVIILLYIPFIWISICLSAKRMHDCNHSGWMQLVPVYNFIAMGFFKGTPGENRFGPNPLSQ